MKLAKIAAAAIVAMSLAACGEMVEVPNAYVGKIKTSEGMRPEILPPSKFRLDICAAYCDRLYLAEVSDVSYSEEFKVYMPKDKLNMEFDLRVIGSVRSNEASINQIFDKIPVEYTTSGSGFVSAVRVYKTYVQPVIRSVARDIVTNYTIDQVGASRAAINDVLQKRIEEALANTPFRVQTLQIADVQFPQVIVEAEIAAKKREVEIKEQNSKNEIRYLSLAADLEAAKQTRAIDREKAEGIREQNAIYAESVTEGYLKWKQLEVVGILAANPNTVFLPFSALDTIGMSNRIMNAK